MARISAGVLLYRSTDGCAEVLLVHPGGPFWAKKDAGAWSIPKGEVEEGEDLLVAAKREFWEETGFRAEGVAMTLGSVRQHGGKIVHVWAVPGNVDTGALHSNHFELEWPPKSGRHQRFPEADRAEWFGLAEARRRILSGQLPLLDAFEVIYRDGRQP